MWQRNARFNQLFLVPEKLSLWYCTLWYCTAILLIFFTISRLRKPSTADRADGAELQSFTEPKGCQMAKKIIIEKHHKIIIRQFLNIPSLTFTIKENIFNVIHLGTLNAELKDVSVKVRHSFTSSPALGLAAAAISGDAFLLASSNPNKGCQTHQKSIGDSLNLPKILIEI